MEEIVEESQEKKGSFWDELFPFILVAILIVVPFRLVVAQPFIVSGSSMLPTFEHGDYLIVDQLSYHLRKPERLESAIFKYPLDTSKFFIKRVVGLPGEKLEILDNEVFVTDEFGKRMMIDEPYIEFEESRNVRVTLDDDEYFLIGDNRSGSSDSRVWGPVKEDLMVGRAYLRLLPIKHMGVLPGDFSEE